MFDNVEDPLLIKMQSKSREWEHATDRRAIFLACYTMMTHNMTASVRQQEFHDSEWAYRFIGRFADYYFEALAAYEEEPLQSPRVWQIAHQSCHNTAIQPLQLLLLGINAHINYDLVLTLEELLRPEWNTLNSSGRAARLADYQYVNDIIGRTIDAVQDDILAPEMPFMRRIDMAMGPADEWLLSRLLARWRSRAWRDTMLMLAAGNTHTRLQITKGVEISTVRRAKAICRPQRISAWRKIL
jgi:hypothetical protein